MINVMVELNIHIVKANENSYTVYFAQSISLQILRIVRHFCHALEAQSTHTFSRIIPAYNNVLVSYKKQTLSTSTMVDFLRGIAYQCFEQNNDLELEGVIQTHRLPAYYHPEVGMDIEAVIAHGGLSSLEQLVDLHSRQEYTVYAIGFCPGFAYLAEVAEPLRIPRHQTPRLTVPAGSIAIADVQTAVYPIATSGGWHIIGHCPLSLTPNHHNLNQLWQMADKVIFEPIDQKMHRRLLNKPK